MMPSSRKGKGTKKIERRPVPITPPLATKLHDLTNDRPPSAPLLIKPNQKLRKTASGRRRRRAIAAGTNPTTPGFSRALQAAGLDPVKITMYALRHSNIVRQILAGVPLRVVAVNHDTSVGILERTYSRYIGDHADALARVALLDTTATAGASLKPGAPLRWAKAYVA